MGMRVLSSRHRKAADTLVCGVEYVRSAMPTFSIENYSVEDGNIPVSP